MEAREHFAELIDRADAEIPLAEAALWISAESRPEVRVPSCLDELERLGERASNAQLAAGDDAERIARLNHLLFVEEGFAGNRDDYDDPRNSFLDQVLERRTGIPITLSLVYLELADAIGRPMEGVSFPGHFLVRDHESGLLLDPFDHGRIVDRDECLAILAGIGLSEEDWSEDFLNAADPREILHRMINNLRGCYNRAGDQRRLAILEEIFSMLQSGKEDGSRLQ